MTSYTSAGAIAAFLGATLTSPQATQAGVMATAASDFIERALHRSWLGWVSGSAIAVTAEQQVVRGCRLWLDHAPVEAISAVSVRRRSAGAITYELTLPHQYELLVPVTGELVFSPTYDAQLLTVSYSSKEPIPPLIGQFATELAAGMLTLSLAGAAGSVAALSGVRRYTLWGGDLSVEYATSAASQDGSAPGSTRLPALWERIEAIFSRNPVVA